MGFPGLSLTNISLPRHHQKGVSGNKDDGADAITVSQNLLDERFQDPNDEFDNFSKFVYEANYRNGARALSRSRDLGKPVRVFRSSNLEGPLRAINAGRRMEKQVYRYDGLYYVDWEDDGVYYDRRFFLRRAEAGRSTKTKNARTADSHIAYCRFVAGTLGVDSKKRRRVEATYCTVSK